MAALFVSACTNAGPGTVRVGVILPLSGDLGSVGASMSAAAQLAADEVNAGGGVLGGRYVEVIVRDSESDTLVAARRLRQLIDDDGVVAIVGPARSAAVAETWMSAAEAGVIQISPSSTSPDLTQVAGMGEERNLFRTAPSDLFQANVLIRHAVDTVMCTRVAILFLNDAYGMPFSTALQSGFSAEGVMVVATVPFEAERSSYAEQVGMVAAAMPDCIALIGFPESAGRILADWDDLAAPPSVTWLGTDGLRDPGLVVAAGGDMIGRMRVDGMVGSAPIITPATAAFNEYRDRYQLATGSDPGIFSGNTYDAMAVILLGIQAAGSAMDPAAIRAGVRRVAARDGAGDRQITPRELGRGLAVIEQGGDIDYLGASGEVDFDAYGEVLTDYEVWRYEAASDSFQTIDVIMAEEL